MVIDSKDVIRYPDRVGRMRRAASAMTTRREPTFPPELEYYSNPWTAYSGPETLACLPVSFPERKRTLLYGLIHLPIPPRMFSSSRTTSLLDPMPACLLLPGISPYLTPPTKQDTLGPSFAQAFFSLWALYLESIKLCCGPTSRIRLVPSGPSPIP